METRKRRTKEEGFATISTELVFVSEKNVINFSNVGGTVVLPENFEKEMESHHHCGSDAREVTRINNTDLRSLTTSIAISERIPLSQAQRLVQNFY